MVKLFKKKKRTYKYHIYERNKIYLNIEQYNKIKFKNGFKLPSEILTLIIGQCCNYYSKLICKQIYYLTQTNYFQELYPWINTPYICVREIILDYKCILAVRYNNYYTFKWCIEHGADWWFNIQSEITPLTDIRIIDLFINKFGHGKNLRNLKNKIKKSGEIKNINEAINMYKELSGIDRRLKSKKLENIIQEISKLINYPPTSKYNIVWI
jgi:hypothetical protein